MLQEVVGQANQQKKDQIKLPSIEIIEGDLLKSKWPEEADIVYSSSVCFPKELTEAIGQMCVRLKSGSIVISLDEFSTPNVKDFLEEVRFIKMKMTWGVQTAYIYRRK